MYLFVTDSLKALLRGALSQQSAVILVCMAVDRYMCALHPRRYYQHSSKKRAENVFMLLLLIFLNMRKGLCRCVEPYMDYQPNSIRIFGLAKSQELLTKGLRIIYLAVLNVCMIFQRRRAFKRHQLRRLIPRNIGNENIVHK
uniref:G-protein coupled receptors family 1 profile domain-containing protein n=1 Tax=Glossina pallidipes TaxID=7398 RepID=A0A1A9Z7M7_GLOPL